MQVVGAQGAPQAFAVPPPPQVCGNVHVPHASVPPQPFDAVPHVCPAGQVVLGVQPHTFPTPQVWGAVQVPQDSVPPHPLEGVPHVKPRAAQVVGVQVLVPQTFGMAPAPQI